MDLWIRSQDKEVLMKVGNIKYVEYNGNHILNAFNTDQMGDFDIGIYSTKERALEVLDEIQGIITRNEALKTMMPSVSDLNGYEEKFGELFKEMVYEMPDK